MPTTDNDTRRDAIRRTLAHRAGRQTHPRALAEATTSTWHQITVCLAPVIGVGGVDALFRRSLHLVSKDFPWLAIVGGEGSSTSLLAALQSCLADHEADSSKEASVALLLVFTDLLTAMIGLSLSERLLGPVWAPRPSAASATEQESTS